MKMKIMFLVLFIITTMMMIIIIIAFSNTHLLFNLAEEGCHDCSLCPAV